MEESTEKASLVPHEEKEVGSTRVAESEEVEESAMDALVKNVEDEKEVENESDYLVEKHGDKEDTIEVQSQIIPQQSTYAKALKYHILPPLTGG